VQRSTDLLARVGARLAGAVLNALPRKLPTGTAWQHTRPATLPERPVPVTGIARGRARVIQSTVDGADE
jgi:hypothetical protein